MKPFDIPDDETWPDAAGEPTDPADDAGSARPSIAPAPDGGILAYAKRWLTRWHASRRGARRQDDPCGWFDEIFKTRHGLVWGMLLKAGIPPAWAEEIVQDVFVILHMQKSEIHNVDAMLVTITGHQINNYRKKCGNGSEVDHAVDLDEVPASRPNPEQQMDGAQHEQIFWRSFAELPPDLAKLIRWIDLEGRTQETVASELKIPLGTVKSRHRAAKERLAKLVEQHFEIARRGGT